MSIQVERWSEETPLDEQELKARLQGEGYSVFQWTDPAGTKYGPHAHAEDQSHWILSGSWNCASATKSISCAPAIEIFFQRIPRIQHSCRATSQSFTSSEQNT